MAEYYLISQLPSLDAVGEHTPMPIDEERFLELCRRHLKKKIRKDIEELTITPPLSRGESCSALLDAWYEGEKNLRLALGVVRAERMNKSFDTEDNSLPEELIKVAGEAAGAENPLEAERFLLSFRLKFLESLRPMDTFSDDFLFYYGIKLKLMTRMKAFDKKLGETAYRDIYDSVLNGVRTEAI